MASPMIWIAVLCAGIHLGWGPLRFGGPGRPPPCPPQGRACTYDYCIRFFQASKDSATMDKHGLIFIAMGISRATAVNTRKRIAALKAGGKDEKIQTALATCDQLYSGAMGRIDEAARVIASGKLFDALTSLDGTLDVPFNCEEQFRKTGVHSPLADEGYEFFNECVFTKAVTGQLWY